MPGQYAMELEWEATRLLKRTARYDTNGMIPYLHNCCIENLEIFKSSWVGHLSCVFARVLKQESGLLLGNRDCACRLVILGGINIHNNEIICREQPG